MALDSGSPYLGHAHLPDGYTGSSPHSSCRWARITSRHPNGADPGIACSDGGFSLHLCRAARRRRTGIDDGTHLWPARCTSRRSNSTWRQHRHGLPNGHFRWVVTFLDVLASTPPVTAKQCWGAPAHEAFQAAVNNLSNTVDEDHPELLQARKLLASN